jgi:hypothetical protein
VFNEEKICWDSKVLTVFNKALVGLLFFRGFTSPEAVNSAS